MNLYVRKGEFVTFLGPSGCGKTTTLRMIAGFEMPTEGKILLNGKDISNLPPNRRPVNTVFQKYALFPHLNVFDNVAFGLKLKEIETPYVDKKGRQKIKRGVFPPFREGSSSVSPSPAPLSTSRKFSSSTSRSARSISK